MLDSRLNFYEHTIYLTGKTFAKIKLLGRLKYTLDHDTLLMLYKSLILPIFDFADVIYHGLNQAEAEELQQLQNTACRSILHTDMYAYIVDMHEKLKLDTLHQRRCKHVANQMHKFKNNIGPPE